jgi:hypothetical protein
VVSTMSGGEESATRAIAAFQESTAISLTK